MKAAIDAAIAAREKKLEITAERVLRELALMGFANLRDYVTPEPDGTARVDLSGLTHDQAAAIRELSSEEVTTGQGALALRLLSDAKQTRFRQSLNVRLRP